MLRDRLCNLLLYKAVFLFGVLNSVVLEEIVVWIFWFSVISLLSLLQIIVIHRFKYFASSLPSQSVQFRSFVLALFCFVGSAVLTVFAFWSFNVLSISYSLFILADALKLIVRGTYAFIKSAFLINSISSLFSSSNMMSVSYYLDFANDLASDIVDLLHYTHMLLYSQIVLSMACIVLSMQIRSFYMSLTTRISRHLKYRRITAHISTNYREATESELSAEASCAICWEQMSSARVLPCNHYFHEWCLRGWLEQDSSCPTCRIALSSSPDVISTTQQNQSQNNVQTFNHFFHFDGARYARWLPSFSFELSHNVGPRLFHRNRFDEVETSQLNSIAEQVRELFPQMDMATIMDDVRETGSAQATIENILEGRLIDQSNAFQLQSSLDSETDAELTWPVSEPPETPTRRRDSFDLNTRADLWERTPVGSSTEAYGCRFSAQSTERHDILSRRKIALIELNRKRYIASPRGADLRTRNLEP
ncbi:hypothetical protein AB6A40_009748 [Gnathostoma spinigerum]|uniref:Uncharacterized protein n=1 Tax=Gnathostoma spinigerum TaxID=75299 RepID=A0ABD6ESU0_9BILA